MIWVENLWKIPIPLSCGLDDGERECSQYKPLDESDGLRSSNTHLFWGIIRVYDNTEVCRFPVYSQCSSAGIGVYLPKKKWDIHLLFFHIMFWIYQKHCRKFRVVNFFPRWPLSLKDSLYNCIFSLNWLMIYIGLVACDIHPEYMSWKGNCFWKGKSVENVLYFFT